MASQSVTAGKELAARIDRMTIEDLVGERLMIAMRGGHLPDQDPTIAAPALLGALIEGLVGPLAAPADRSNTRDTVQAITLFALRAVGVADARARGLVVQARMPV